ncbi:ATP-binding protein [Pendulispora albinea]|uniref:ATP-binding protein n=1 Tax=Pendulispora albinea TaxID=2741071 RepID=UPI00374E15F7
MEWAARESKRLDRLLKDARVPDGVSLEELSCEAGRGGDRSFARTLGACQWVRAKPNVIVLGAAGAGKASWELHSLKQVETRRVLLRRHLLCDPYFRRLA